MSEETQGAELSANVENSPLSAASGSETQSVETKAPVEANSTSTQPEASEPFHKNPRFQELVHEKNELRDKVSQMERLLQEKLTPAGPSPYDMSRDELVALGIQKEAADKMLKSFDRLVEARVQERVGPIQQKTSQAEIDQVLADFSRTHEDYEKVEPEMARIFNSLSKESRMLVASDPRKITELLYGYAKGQNSKADIDAAYQRGVADGYKGKASKSSVSPGLPGSANPPGGQFSRSQISKMSSQEFQKLAKEIWAAGADGRILDE